MIELGYGRLNDRGEFLAKLNELENVAPYCNIIAGKSFGTIISSNGGGWTYINNSREQKITNWCNDALSDTPSEWLTLDYMGERFSISKKPLEAKGARYSIRHGFGESEFCCDYKGIESSLTHFIDTERAVKYYDLSILNSNKEGIMLNIELNFNFVLGDFKAFNHKYLRRSKDDDGEIINLKNALKVSVRAAEFIEVDKDADGGGRASKPVLKGLESKENDHIHSFCFLCDIKEGETKRFVFALNASAESVDFSMVDSIKKRTTAYFSSLNPIRIKTEDARLDALFNHWLMYQVLCSRFNARAGYYQAGGAIGFRDQLQDCLSLLYLDKKLVRDHIIECASHQFLEGDVQHWWHPKRLGVRTRITDDKLFLPFLVCEYINFSGDHSILEQCAYYLADMKIEQGAESAYGEPAVLKKSESIFMHCVRAIDSALRLSPRSLCLIGGGDWNDGMDKVGHEGRGESVWLSMFLIKVLRAFSIHCDEARKNHYHNQAIKIENAINKHCWDGEWFVRAFYDDGSPLGSKNSEEAKIDSLCQSWATIADIGDSARQKTALASVESRLVEENARLIRLLDPPFNPSSKLTGYIQQYPFGVRENGGQYTHAAIWYIIAQLRAGESQKAYKNLKMINPLEICKKPNGALRYKIEPYVLAGDVYFGQGRDGRGGWSWYTGSASWAYRCILEEFLGIKKRGGRLYIAPLIPPSWQGFSASLSMDGLNFDIEVVRGKSGIVVDTVAFNCGYVTLEPALNGKKILVGV